jgi:hypothetical protein
MVVLLVQILLFGTQVREAIDRVATEIQHPCRSGFLPLGLDFIIHRSFSWAVLDSTRPIDRKIMENSSA